MPAADVHTWWKCKNFYEEIREKKQFQERRLPNRDHEKGDLNRCDNYIIMTL